MREFKDVVSVTGLRRGDFAYEKIMKRAICHFSEVPKILTLARHTDLEEDTPIHCLRTDGVVIDYSVPKQDLHLRLTKTGLRFSVVRVVSSRFSTYWMVACENYRKGFLVPYLLLKEIDF